MSKKGRQAALGVATFLFLALLLDYGFYPWNDALPGTVSGNQGENGLWLHYSWYFGQHSVSEVERLGQDLTRHQVRYAYFHVRFIGKSGSLRFRHPQEACRLNTTLHHSAPGIKSIAWIYVGNTRGRGSITDLSDAVLRRRMVQEAQFLVNECGFDGIQWDYEICPDGDVGLLALLDETRTALPKGKVVSAATALLEPIPMQHFGYGWSATYFGEVAQRCDQIAIMGYDSGVYMPRTYAGLISDQMTEICPAVRKANPRCRVLIGVPTYEAGGLSHHAHAENLSVAIRGVRGGYQRLPFADRAVFAGIAPFADTTTNADEWRQYQKEWLQRRP